jgi:hypothetical protein
MIPKEIILKAIEGGWGVPDGKDATYSKYAYLGYSESGLYEKCYDGVFYSFGQIALDPTFWQALGSAFGWGDTEMENGNEPFAVPWYLLHAHRFYDLILTGKDTTQFWSDLLGNKE